MCRTNSEFLPALLCFVLLLKIWLEKKKLKYFFWVKQEDIFTDQSDFTSAAGFKPAE